MSTLFDTQDSPRPLWPHQQRTLQKVRERSLAGCSRIAIQLPTGAGKTVLAVEMTRYALAKNKRVLIIMPRLSLVGQWLAAFAAVGIHRVGVLQGDHPGYDPEQPIQVATIQTLRRRKRPPADVIIVDECHLHVEAIAGWLAEAPGRIWVVGLSATPWAQGMAPVFGELIIGAFIQELIEAGVLVPFHAFSPSEPDLAGVHVRAGDFAEDELADRCNTTKLVGDIIDEWSKRGEDRPTLSFGVNRAHAQHIQQRFSEVGIACEYIDAYVERRDREAIFDRFRRGETKIISSVATLEVGIDLPMASCIIDARPTKSRMAFVQRIGRGLRVAPGKADCIILDHAGNHLRLGMVTDIHQDRLDDGSKAENSKQREAKERAEPLPKLCDECKAVIPPKANECPCCGAPVLTRMTVAHEPGELIEFGSLRTGKVEPTVAEKAIFFAELRGYAEARGYAEGWLAHKYREKFGVWPNDPRIRSWPALSPSLATRNWIKSRQIAFAKGRRAHG
jgi:DNA repair protein RadD